MAENQFDLNALERENDGDDDLVRNLRAAIKAANRQLKEKDGQLSEYVKEKRTGGIASILKSKGFDPGVARDLGDVEPTEDAVMAWLGERPWIKPVDPDAVPSETPGNGAQTPVQPGVDPALLAALAAAGNLAQFGQPVTQPLGDVKVVEGAQKALADGPAAFAKYMRENGLGNY